MKTYIQSFFVVILLSLITERGIAQHEHPPSSSKAVALVPQLGKYHHPISTSSAEAQQFFDQGMLLAIGFNHEAAIQSFQHAAELDPKAPMPHWGIAFALGPNINDPGDSSRHTAAYDAIQKARSLSSNGTENERAYIEALSKRYSNNPNRDLSKLAVDYKNAMAELTKRYSDDLDVTVLYADAIMNLYPWKWWSLDGRPAEGTAEAIAVLESVLKRDPNHIYANHLYIHAIEESPYPERALPSATRLGPLAPLAGHLVHMPFHIYFRTGDYLAAAKSNEAAIQADRTYLEATGTHESFYGMMYYNHNVHSLAMSLSMAGQFAEAIKAANELAENFGGIAKQVPAMVSFIDSYTATYLFIYLRFQRWNEILALKAPDQNLPVTTALWHFARGIAFAAMGKIKNARTEQQAFVAAVKKVPSEFLFGFYNSANDGLDLASVVLDARIKAAEGSRKAPIDLWRKAVQLQDVLYYDEPPAWYYPVRESLGGELLRDGQYAEAEKVFRVALERNPRNGRSLFGLLESLKGQKKITEAQWIQREFENAWMKADSQLRVEDL